MFGEIALIARSTPSGGEIPLLPKFSHVSPSRRPSSQSRVVRRNNLKIRAGRRAAAGAGVSHRFLSTCVNRVDAKGRVSVPPAFRAALKARKADEIYALRAIDAPALNCGGLDLLDRFEARIASEDPFLRLADDLSHYIHGDSAFLKLDAEGRVALTDFVRDAAGVTDEVAFLGRGDFFQLWEPKALAAHTAAVRARLSAMRGGLA
jgi:MraZ protein